MKLLSLIFLLLLASPVFAEMWVGEWEEVNNPIVVKYLKHLSSTDIGKTMQGVQLIEGPKELAGTTLVNIIVDSDQKSFIHVFQEDAKTNVAYVWVEKGGTSFQLPLCTGSDPRNAWPGWGGRTLSEEVYTYSEVHPGYGIVKTRCVPRSWLAKATKTITLIRPPFVKDKITPRTKKIESFCSLKSD